MASPNYYLVAPLVYSGTGAGFTYHSEQPMEPGQIVGIPLGKRSVLGVVEHGVEQPAFSTKPVTQVLPLPPLPSDLVQLGAWLASYYAANPSSVWSTMLPAGLARKRHEPKASAKSAASPPYNPPPLTSQQANALANIRQSARTAHLLQGVTGSGKTRIYLELAADCLAAGKSVLILVPEITLTPQVVGQFEASFGHTVLTSHSKLTEAARHRIWSEAINSAAAKTPRVIVGPRSCLFMPAHNLGLIVIDECHETAYKQEQNPRYHALPTAAKRAGLTGARLILGSATPGLQELFLAQQGRVEHHILSQQANGISPPQAIIIDLRNKDLLGLSKFITQPLVEAITQTRQAGRQTLLYLNRRGSASSQVCGDCGRVSNCPNCLLPLTFHADLLRLVCHHCNFRQVSPAVCPGCNGSNLRLLGGGTKRIEAEIQRLFPDARIARLDRDSATLAHLHTVLRGLRAQEIDVLIGTQMIAKGLDLPAIDTVGIVSADTMLHVPDFAAAERTYQLISQAAGRTGRGDRPGQVFIQTYTPEHPAIIAAASQAYADFSSCELAERKALSYPPYVFLLKLTVTKPTREAAQQDAAGLASHLRSNKQIQVIGPAPAFIETQTGRFRWVLTVKSKTRTPLVDIAGHLPDPGWSADLDPVNLL